MDYSKLVRPEVASMKAYTPGTTVSQARKKYGLAQFVKLSSNENPLGTSPKAAAALRDMGDLQIYVDDDHAELRRRLAETYRLRGGHVSAVARTTSCARCSARISRRATRWCSAIRRSRCFRRTLFCSARFPCAYR